MAGARSVTHDREPDPDRARDFPEREPAPHSLGYPRRAGQQGLLRAVRGYRLRRR